ncbi:MAG: hypothetical protein ACREX3_23125, partial [Gammaproteobacteria bacterium]
CRGRVVVLQVDHEEWLVAHGDESPLVVRVGAGGRPAGAGRYLAGVPRLDRSVPDLDPTLEDAPIAGRASSGAPIDSTVNRPHLHPVPPHAVVHRFDCCAAFPPASDRTPALGVPPS